jgi:hypothetical protein
MVVTANVVPSSPILVPLIMGTIHFSESVLRTATQRNIPEDGILQSHRSAGICNVEVMFPARYELGLYISEAGILNESPQPGQPVFRSTFGSGTSE